MVKTVPRLATTFTICANVLVSRKFNVVQVVCDPGSNSDHIVFYVKSHYVCWLASC